MPPIANRRRPPWQRLPALQLAVVSVISLLALWGSGIEALHSALLGGLVSLVPTLYFLWRGLWWKGRPRRGQHSRAMVENFYRAAAGKFGLTVALFVVVFITAPPSNPAFFFITYVAAQGMHWLAPWLLRGRPIPRT